MIFEDASQKLTREDILGEWPEDFDKPSPSGLRNWLESAAETNMIACEGSGRKKDPFRYWFPAGKLCGKKIFFTQSGNSKKGSQTFQSLREKKREDRESDRYLNGFAKEIATAGDEQD